MAGTAHLVGRASVEVEAGGVDGFRFQDEVAGWVHGRLLPELEALLDSLPTVEGHVVLDRLELVLEAGTSDDWQDRAIAGLRDALTKSLGRKLSESRDSGTERLAASESFLRSWRHYLEHGALPWNWILPDSAAMEAGIEAWLDQIEESGVDATHADSLASSLRTGSARHRLLALSAERVERILALVFGIAPQTQRRWVRDLEHLEEWIGPDHRSESRSGPKRRDLFEAVLATLSTRSRPTSGEIERSVELAVRQRLVEMSVSHDDIAGMEFESPGFRALLRERSAATAERSSSSDSTGRDDDDGTVPTDPSSASDSRRNPSRPREADEGNRSPRAMASQIEEGFHIANAGLILVGPYLPLLFERMELRLARAEQDAMVTGDQALAMASMHYLATGRDDPSEFELVLAKILCGLEPESSFEGPIALDSRAREEADQLLASVLGHWGALKDTSIDGLRDAFLQRPGKLALRDGFWRLQVEQKPWDMLLEQLPWSLQFTKLPWMARTLKTEWME